MVCRELAGFDSDNTSTCSASDMCVWRLPLLRNESTGQARLCRRQSANVPTLVLSCRDSTSVRRTKLAYSCGDEIKSASRPTIEVILRQTFVQESAHYSVISDGYLPEIATLIGRCQCGTKASSLIMSSEEIQCGRVLSRVAIGLLHCGRQLPRKRCPERATARDGDV
jgi:hypothetical protein